MTWQRIDDDTYIDDTLVTCAEYQLFIDEMREQGKYYQPDHWTSYQFPTGQAREPILGVRYSDAVTFCEWLTSREERVMYFRVPTYAEVAKYSLAPAKLSLPLGYWSMREFGTAEFAWVKPVPNNPRALTRDKILFHTLESARQFTNELDQYLARFLKLALELSFKQEPSHDIGISIDSNHAYSPEFNINLKRDLERIPELSKTLDQAIISSRTFVHNFGLAPELANALVRARELVHDIYRSLSGSPILDLTHTRAITLDLDIAITITRYYSDSFNLDRELALAVALDLDLDRNIEHEVAHILGHGIPDNIDSDQSLRAFVDLSTLYERIAGRSPAFEGIRLVKERIK